MEGHWLRLHRTYIISDCTAYFLRRLTPPGTGRAPRQTRTRTRIQQRKTKPHTCMQTQTRAYTHRNIKHTLCYVCKRSSTSTRIDFSRTLKYSLTHTNTNPRMKTSAGAYNHTRVYICNHQQARSIYAIVDKQAHRKTNKTRIENKHAHTKSYTHAYKPRTHTQIQNINTHILTQKKQ